EFCLGVGLILTASSQGAIARSVRGATSLLFIVATCALIELRANRPEVGCGCFGDFSTTPVSLRSLARSALLAVAAFAAIWLRPGELHFTPPHIAELVGLLFAELLLFGALSPEIGEGLIRLGYSEPCELQVVSSQRTLSALHRSRQWRRYSPLIATDGPADVWRELCWRYVVYPARYNDAPADVVFAVFLQRRRPAIRAALVDGATGETLRSPTAPTMRSRLRRRYARLAPQAAGAAAGPTAMAATANLPVSTDV
ncbi:MAG: hypothetical protein J2P29_07675, partial [Actinobacteria bacterium]|nr:hypothetical protein [Actinomycetota bacterium]